MPIYEYRCRACGGVSTSLASMRDIPPHIACDRCGEAATRILSRPSVHRSAGSKVSRLDPKYDRMVDKAMRGSSAADPDRLINARGDIAKGRPE